VGKALAVAVAVGGCQQGPSTLGAEGRQGRCARGRREEGHHMGTRVGERGSRGSEGPGASRNQILDLVSGVQQGPRQCSRWERGASTRDMAGTLCQGWCARGGCQVVYNQATMQGALRLSWDGRE